MLHTIGHGRLGPDQFHRSRHQSACTWLLEMRVPSNCYVFTLPSTQHAPCVVDLKPRKSKNSR